MDVRSAPGSLQLPVAAVGLVLLTGLVWRGVCVWREDVDFVVVAGICSRGEYHLATRSGRPTQQA
ncbi:hypothetical protein ACFQGE_14845 [Halomicroarcula sp. GCM10025817]|uniref:hypothetical protein n=1 Tax=Haloarcula TaxID=2237 RepID=UPI0023E8272A|nr:hypothetical protein [Halomicroarcula sp. SYNS111]